MVDEALVKELVARILTDPRFQALLTPAQPIGSASKPKALIVVDSEAAKNQLSDIQARWSNGYSLFLCLTAAVDAPAVNLPRMSYDQALAETGWSRILAPVCSGGQLAQIAMGLRNDKLSELVGQAILQGILVEIDRVDFGFTDRTPAAYRQLMEGYLTRVAAYGVTIGPAQAEPAKPGLKDTLAAAVAAAPMPWSCGEPAVSAEPESRTDMTYDKILMTEKEAILLPDHAVLRLLRATILTPSAIDALKRKKVQVYREGVRYL